MHRAARRRTALDARCVGLLCAAARGAVASISFFLEAGSASLRPMPSIGSVPSDPARSMWIVHGQNRPMPLWGNAMVACFCHPFGTQPTACPVPSPCRCLPIPAGPVPAVPLSRQKHAPSVPRVPCFPRDSGGRGRFLLFKLLPAAVRAGRSEYQEPLPVECAAVAASEQESGCSRRRRRDHAARRPSVLRGGFFA